MSEKLKENNVVIENSAVSFEQSLGLAKKLYAEFEPAIRANLDKEMDGAKEARDYPNLIRHFLKEIPDEKQERYAGHGITKTSGVIENPTLGQLAAFLNILATGEIKGSWALLKNSGYSNAYTSGPFLILSHRDGNFVRGQRQSIGAAIVNAEFYPMVEKLKELFPDMNIIKASELPDYMRNKDDI